MNNTRRRTRGSLKSSILQKPIFPRRVEVETAAERKLWQILCTGPLADFKFRRRHSIGPFIVGFCCFEKKLVIELDGGEHAEYEIDDMRRTEFLNRYGFTVLRFWDNEVLRETDTVVKALENYLLNPKPPSSVIRAPSRALRAERH